SRHPATEEDRGRRVRGPRLGGPPPARGHEGRTGSLLRRDRPGRSRPLRRRPRGPPRRRRLRRHPRRPGPRPRHGGGVRAGRGRGGGGLGMVGADVLAGELALAGGDHRVAFARYEERLRGYARACQEGAARVGPFFAPPTRARLWIRNQVYRTLTSRPLAGFFE